MEQNEKQQSKKQTHSKTKTKKRVEKNQKTKKNALVNLGENRNVLTLEVSPSFCLIAFNTIVLNANIKKT